MGTRCRDVDLSLVTERVLFNQLKGLSDGPVSVSGWVETVRDQKKVQFVILRDETGAVQLVNPATRPAEDGSNRMLRPWPSRTSSRTSPPARS